MWMWSPEALDALGDGHTGSCEPPDLGIGNPAESSTRATYM